MPDLDYPNQNYYPSVKVRLRLRLDEFDVTAPLKDLTPKKVITKLKGTKDVRSMLSAVADTDAPPGINRFKLQADTPSPGGPQEQSKSKDNLTHAIAGIIPKSMNLGLNGLRQADTLKVEIKYIDLPFDPRCIRSCAIEAYMGTVSADDFIKGNAGQVRSVSSGDSEVSEPLNVIPDTYVDEKGKSRTNLRFQGWVDEWEIEFQEGAEPVVRLTCRDNTTLMLDTDAPPALTLAVDQPIDKTIATYLSNFPTLSGMTVEYRPNDAEIPKLKGQLSKTAYNADTGGPSPAKGGGTGGKLSIWDYLTDICGIIGLTIRVEGTRVIIQRVRDLLAGTNQNRSDDPYADRSSGDFPTRAMIYGRNVLSMKLSRKFGKGKPKNIQVNSYNIKNKTKISVKFPSTEVTSTANPGDGHNEAEYQVINISGIDNEKTLRVVAQSYYETVGRNELNVSIRTKNLASFGGGNLDPDLLDMIAGDTITVLVSREESEFNTVSVIENAMLAQERAEQFLRTIGYEGEFAKAYAKAYTDAGFQTSFKVRAIGYNWDNDQGIAIDIQAVNFIEVRADKPLPTGEEEKAAPKKKKG